MSPFKQPGLGFNSSVQMKRETAYGTAATGTAEHASEIVSAEITPRLSAITDPSLTNTQRSPRFIGQGGLYYEWTVKVRAGYTGMLPWIRMMFPSYAFATVETSARSHTFKEVSDTGPGTKGAPAAAYGYNVWGYTLEINWGGVPSATPYTRLVGALATGLRFTCQAGTGDGAMLMCEISGVAKSVTPSQALSLTAASLPSALGVIFHQQLRTTGNFGIGTGMNADDIQMKSMDVNITQPFDSQRFLFGQLNAEAPVPSGLMDCTFNYELEYTDGTAFNTVVAAYTPATIKFFFQHPTIIGATTAKSEFEIRALNPTPAEYGTAIPGYGVVTQRMSFKAAYSATDFSAVVIRVQNTEATMFTA